MTASGTTWAVGKGLHTSRDRKRMFRLAGPPEPILPWVSFNLYLCCRLRKRIRTTSSRTSRTPSWPPRPPPWPPWPRRCGAAQGSSGREKRARCANGEGKHAVRLHWPHGRQRGPAQRMPAAEARLPPPGATERASQQPMPRWTRVLRTRVGPCPAGCAHAVASLREVLRAAVAKRTLGSPHPQEKRVHVENLAAAYAQSKAQKRSETAPLS
jgi:hypothetical protein